MDIVSSSAPGKLVLIGEYAVLEGAPAIAVAIDVRARVSLQLRTEPGGLLRVTDPAGSFPFRWKHDGTVSWEAEAPGKRGEMLEAAAATVARAGLVNDPAPGFELQIDSAAFYARSTDGSVQKFGLGSSAAVAVALTGALLQLLTGAPGKPAGLLELCLQVHSRFQSGAGSGVDIACSLMGKTIALQPVTKGIPQVSQLDWPKGLIVLPVWTGVQASTPEMLRRADKFRLADRRRHDRHMGRLRDIATAALLKWRSGAVRPLLGQISEYADALQGYDDDAGIGIYSAAHLTLLGIAQQNQVVYKPAGAGGGDCGFFVTDSAAARSALQADVNAAGFAFFDARLSIDGSSINGLQLTVDTDQ